MEQDSGSGITDRVKQTHLSTATDDQRSSNVTEGICSYCNGSGNVKTCSGCRKTQYCSRVCQKADWKSHKHRCDAHKQVILQ